jgi:hypothetical protein
MPWTAPSRIARSPTMSERYSLSSVVANVYGEPSATDHASARSVARAVGVGVHGDARVDPGAVDLAPCS